MQHRLKELRLYFGLDAATMAEILGATSGQVERWERSHTFLTEDVVGRYAERFGVASGWLTGEEASVWGPRLEGIRRQLRAHIQTLTGSRLVQLITATTGERIAYAVNWMRRADPTLCTLQCMACWLGLSPVSTDLLLQGRLDPGSPVVLRASDLTGLPDRWFRIGPVERLADENDRGDLD